MASEVYLKRHEKFLREKVYFVKTKWPQFDLLFKDINKISKKINKNTNVLSIERGGLYGNISLLAPFFVKEIFIQLTVLKIYKKRERLIIKI